MSRGESRLPLLIKDEGSGFLSVLPLHRFFGGGGFTSAAALDILFLVLYWIECPQPKSRLPRASAFFAFYGRRGAYVFMPYFHTSLFFSDIDIAV